jgi:geranylgeranyl reductase family protein
MTSYDAIVVGAGPAGSACAIRLALGGRRVLLLERSRFPRDKVCGDCLNPSAHPVLDRLGVGERVRALSHVIAHTVSYHGIETPAVECPLRRTGEMVVKRRDLDDLLVRRAIELGVDFRDGVSVTGVTSGWTAEAGGQSYQAPWLLAADGRNSTVARLAGRLPAAARERTAIQCHCARPAWHGDAVRMLFYPEGYGGTAAVNEREINLCLVARPQDLERVRARAMEEFALPADTEWRTIAPLSRGDATEVAKDGLLLLGDAAKVIEPFTGEGIYYAMRSGELAAEAILAGSDVEASYRAAHRRMYHGRLWINRLARAGGEHPRLATLGLRLSRLWPAPLEALTARVVRAA